MRIAPLLLATAALAAGTAASAHTAWLVKDSAPGAWRLMFGGHKGKPEPAVPAKLKEVTAVDSRGRALKVSRAVAGSDVRLSFAGQPAIIALHYDNGIHARTKTPGPSVEKPMNEVPNAASATFAEKYGKTIVQWVPLVTRPIGQPLEVTPIAASQPRAGQPMRVQVRLNGKPAAGIKIGRGEDTADATTDANGIASFTPAAGFNKLWAGKRIPTSGNPRYTELSYEVLLGFEAR